jgi:hypothetical protein
MAEENLKEMVRQEIRQYNKTSGFTDRKLGDTPTDAFSLVNRKYVTLNGTTFPASPVTGQMFFSSVTSRPNWYNGTNWVNSTASIVG